MKRVYVNEDWCLGCHLCEYNCAFANSGEKDMALALKGNQGRLPFPVPAARAAFPWGKVAWRVTRKRRDG